ncbi:MAG: hypothetical protein J0M18_04145 [Ignavibacteria bacterium]|nr:hypothetical protein [Ignavibacteria bacterium]
MENDNKDNTNQFYGDDYAKQKQKEYNDTLENRSDTQLNDSAARTNSDEADPSSKDVATDNGYKQNEAEEMSGEVTRKNHEEELEKGADEGGAKDSHGVSVNEAENFGEENEITENTKERATIDHTSRSVI